MNFINGVFLRLEKDAKTSGHPPRLAPQYIPDVRRNVIFIDDAVHFAKDVNRRIAEEIANNIQGARLKAATKGKHYDKLRKEFQINKRGRQTLFAVCRTHADAPRA